MMSDPGRAALRVADVMTRDPVVVAPDTPLGEAAELMRSKECRHLPVADAEGHLFGMVTDRDLIHAAFMPLLAEHLPWDPHRLKALRVRDVMTWSVITTAPDAPLAEAGLRMFQRRIGSLPVVRDGRIVGILTDRDVARAFRKMQGSETAFEAFLW